MSWRPAHSKLIVDSATRNLNKAKVLSLGPKNFENYQDYFFFTHIDPYLRFWHAIGMLIGIVLYAVSLALFNWVSVIILPLAVFFFYGLGAVSHMYYDGSSGTSDKNYFWATFPTVIKINLLTICGLYQKELKRFLVKYPFVIETLDLKGGKNAR